MRHPRVARVAAAAIALSIVMSLFSIGVPSVSAQAGGVNEALQRARAAGSYQFTADIEQQLNPRPMASTIGQSSQQLTWRLEGDVQGSDRARLEISLATGVEERRSATLIQDGIKTFLVKGDSLEEVSNPFSLGTPTSDYLAYVGAADNVRSLDTVPVSYTHLDVYKRQGRGRCTR